MSTVLVKKNTELIDLCDPVVVTKRTELTGGGGGAVWVHRQAGGQCGSTDRQCGSTGSVGPQTGGQCGSTDRGAVWVHRQAVWVHRQCGSTDRQRGSTGSVGPQTGSVGPQTGSMGPQTGGQCGSKRPSFRVCLV